MLQHQLIIFIFNSPTKRFATALRKARNFHVTSAGRVTAAFSTKSPQTGCFQRAVTGSLLKKHSSQQIKKQLLQGIWSSKLQVLQLLQSQALKNWPTKSKEQPFSLHTTFNKYQRRTGFLQEENVAEQPSAATLNDHELMSTLIKIISP